MVNDGPFAHLGRERQSHEPEPVLEPGKLPPVFQFSQQSLQDYVDCARRFQLKYVLGQRWPAIEQEPVEEREDFLERGSQFHLLVQRHLMGIPVEKLTPHDEHLKQYVGVRVGNQGFASSDHLFNTYHPLMVVF